MSEHGSLQTRVWVLCALLVVACKGEKKAIEKGDSVTGDNEL